MAGVGARRDSRRGRRPGPGTWWRSGTRLGAPSRTRRPGRDRAGLPGEPSRGFCQDVPLTAQLTDLTPVPLQLLAFGPGQPVLAAPLVALGLLDPGPDRLGRGLELSRELVRAPSGPNQFDHPPPELRRVRRVGLR